LYVVRECIPCIVSIIIVSWCGLWLFQWTTFQQHQTHWTLSCHTVALDSSSPR